MILAKGSVDSTNVAAKAGLNDAIADSGGRCWPGSSPTKRKTLVGACYWSTPATPPPPAAPAGCETHSAGSQAVFCCTGCRTESNAFRYQRGGAILYGQGFARHHGAKSDPLAHAELILPVASSSCLPALTTTCLLPPLNDRLAAQAAAGRRMRPRTLDEVVGQEHILAPGRPLRALIEADRLSSVILWGPPGTGKTTLARLIAGATRKAFVPMSAVTAGVKDVRDTVAGARRPARPNRIGARSCSSTRCTASTEPNRTPCSPR